MSTHNNLDKICVAIVVSSLVLTTLFMNGEALGITKIVDEDAEQNSDSEYFTTNDQNGSWDTSGATVITLTGDGATISGNGAYTNDGNVVITNAGYYVVTGSLRDGYISVDAYDSSKVYIQLNGVEIDCSDDACIRVDQADKVFLTLAEGSQNILTSGSTYSDEALNDGTDGAIFAHDDLTINGSGSLTVSAEYRHGIAANDDLVITGGTINVTAAADGIRGKDSMRIKEASITVDAGDDGLVTSNEEENGYLYIESGTINVTAADDAVHTTGDITMVGGDVTITAGDDGIHSDSSVFISDGTLLINDCYEGIEALIIDVSGGDVTIYPEDDGFNANGNSDSQIGGGGGPGGNMGGGDMGGHGMSGQGMSGDMSGHGMSDDMSGDSASGDTSGSFGPGGGMGRPDMSGDSASGDTASSSFGPGGKGGHGGPGGQMGGQGDQTEDAQSGSQTEETAGQTPSDGGSTEAGQMPSDGGSTEAGQMPSDGGSTEAGQTPSDGGSTEAGQTPSDMNSSDDSSQTDTESADEETYINITGGTITIINEKGNDADGLDSNGDIFISGGTVYVSLVGSGSNSAVDYGSESGGVAEISGGTIIACGASSMAEAFDTSSTQASILYNTSTTAEAGTTLAIEDTDGNVLLSWDVPCSFSSALVSFPEMEVGGTYVVAIGDNVEEITLEEVSASYGDAQSSMFGGNMNWGGMQSRGGGGQTPPDMAQSGSTSSEFAGQTPPDMAQSGSTSSEFAGQMPPDMAQSGSTSGEFAGQTPPDMAQNGSTSGDMAGQTPPDMSQNGSTSGDMAGQTPPDMAQNGDTSGEAGQMPSDMGQEGMTGGPMMQDQGQQEQSQEEEDQAAEDTVTAEPVTAESWGILGGCAALLAAAIAVAKFYKKH